MGFWWRLHQLRLRCADNYQQEFWGNCENRGIFATHILQSFSPIEWLLPSNFRQTQESTDEDFNSELCRAQHIRKARMLLRKDPGGSIIPLSTPGIWQRSMEIALMDWPTAGGIQTWGGIPEKKHTVQLPQDNKYRKKTAKGKKEGGKSQKGMPLMGMKCLGNCRPGGGSSYSCHLNDTTSVAPRDVYQIAGLAKCVDLSPLAYPLSPFYLFGDSHPRNLVFDDGWLWSDRSSVLLDISLKQLGTEITHIYI